MLNIIQVYIGTFYTYMYIFEYGYNVLEYDRREHI
jgi:hypothetical protein